MSGWDKYTLVFSGTTLGDHLHGFHSRFRRATEVRARHCFWDSDVILDGSYPALIWEHTFTLYTESGSVVGFTQEFLNLADHIQGTPLNLKIITSVGTLVLDFGSCYLQEPDLEKPDMLLFQKAGFVNARFIGNTKPA